MTQKISFESWKLHVDLHLQKLCGMLADDLPDWRYLDDYEDGKTSLQSAKRAIKNAKE